jgi:hypothetical protein
VTEPALVCSEPDTRLVTETADRSLEGFQNAWVAADDWRPEETGRAVPAERSETLWALTLEPVLSARSRPITARAAFDARGIGPVTAVLL